jgi:hypothetical protein
LSGSGLLVPQLAGVVVERVERLADRVLITATAAGERGSCPGCGTNSVRVHSRYQRRVADAPIAGASVVIGVRGRAVFLRLFGLPEADLRRAGPWLDRAVCPSQPWSRADPRGGRVDRVASEGLLLSQFWPDAPPGKHTFPMRNSVMSGYGRATIVVEAGEHSAARIQARRAVAHGAAR